MAKVRNSARFEAMLERSKARWSDRPAPEKCDRPVHVFSFEGEWRDIPAHTGFQASSLGEIRRRVERGGRVSFVKIKPGKTPAGYLSFSFNYTALWVHRLVALAWIPNLDNLPFINHKNGDKADNRPLNLEWCTGQHNTLHAIYELGHVPTYGIRQTVVEKDGRVVFRGRSVRETARFLGCDSNQVSRVCAGGRSHYNGYTIEYL